MKHLPKDIKNIIYDYVYGTKKSWEKYFKKSVMAELTDITDKMIGGIMFFSAIIPGIMPEDKMDYTHIKEYLANNPSILLKSTKEYVYQI